MVVVCMVGLDNWVDPVCIDPFGVQTTPSVCVSDRPTPTHTTKHHPPTDEECRGEWKGGCWGGGGSGVVVYGGGRGHVYQHVV